MLLLLLLLLLLLVVVVAVRLFCDTFIVLLLFVGRDADAADDGPRTAPPASGAGRRWP
jgi:hypothetical protein